MRVDQRREKQISEVHRYDAPGHAGRRPCGPRRPRGIQGQIHHHRQEVAQGQQDVEQLQKYQHLATKLSRRHGGVIPPRNQSRASTVGGGATARKAVMLDYIWIQNVVFPIIGMGLVGLLASGSIGS